MGLVIEQIEHIDIGGRRMVRITWRHPLTALMRLTSAKGWAWDGMVNDWMPADSAKELARQITKALKLKPAKVKGPEAAPEAKRPRQPGSKRKQT